MDIKEIERYTKVIIPNIEAELIREKDKDKLLKLYRLYEDTLILVAPYDFITYNKALEFEEDKREPNKGFYHHRQNHLGDLFNALNDMEIYDKYDMLLLSTAPRVGKALRNSEQVLTPTGWVKIDNIQVDDYVIGDDGKKTKVLGVFPQGDRDVYRVTFDDDTTVDCDLEHLWEVQTRNDRKLNKTRVVTTGNMMKNLYVENGKRKNYSIRYVEPVEFEDKLTSDDLHPYLLGALLGDGSFADGSVTFTNNDEDLISSIKELLPDSDVIKHMTGLEYNITKKDINIRTELGYGVPSHTLNKIREYKLSGTKSSTKFIPKQYLYSSVENRLNLLRGLMDTDGYCVPNGSYNEYTTVSRQLADDVIELIRSLGGRATMTTKVGSYKKDGVTVKCNNVYRITFNMTLNPFHISRKVSLFKPRTTRKVKYIKSIEKVGSDNCTCILVDNKSHLFVTNGYNITHNTTTGIRFLSWIIGRHPEDTQLATSYSDSITSSFYLGVMEIVQSDIYKKIFPDSPLINQNAKRQEIWLKVNRRYPSISFVSIGGSMTGRAEASRYLYCDDLVSGIEEALSLTRLEKLWQLYTVNAKQRKKDGAKEIHIATRWSVHDPITRLARENEDNPRCKVISLPCYDENGESAFDFKGGFTTKYYKELENTMDKPSFNALYLCEPMERDGLLYQEDELQYYFELPNEKPDTIVSVCDSKALGKDYVASPIGYVYGDKIYIEDVVYDNGLPEITVPKVARKWVEHNVVRGDIEMNNGGNFFAENVDTNIKKESGNTSIRMFFTSQNKRTKIITYSDFIKTNFIFKDKTKYAPNSDYAKFMRDLFSWTQVGKNKHDDAPDSLAMLAQMIQELEGNAVKILDRRKLRI